MEMRPALALHTLNIEHKYETMQMQTVMELRGYNLLCNNPENIYISIQRLLQETTTNVSGPWMTLDLSLTISFTHLLYQYQYARSPSLKIQDDQDEFISG